MRLLTIPEARGVIRQCQKYADAKRDFKNHLLAVDGDISTCDPEIWLEMRIGIIYQLTYNQKSLELRPGQGCRHETYDANGGVPWVILANTIRKMNPQWCEENEDDSWFEMCPVMMADLLKKHIKNLKEGLYEAKINAGGG